MVSSDFIAEVRGLSQHNFAALIAAGHRREHQVPQTMRACVQVEAAAVNRDAEARTAATQAYADVAQQLYGTGDPGLPVCWSALHCAAGSPHILLDQASTGTSTAAPACSHRSCIAGSTLAYLKLRMYV